MLASTRLDTRPPSGSSVEDTSCLRRFWTRIRAKNWHGLELPDRSLEVGRRMSWLWAARRAFETMDTSHRLRRALLTSVRASSHTQGIVNGELVHVWRKVKKNPTDARTALVTCGMVVDTEMYYVIQVSNP